MNSAQSQTANQQRPKWNPGSAGAHPDEDEPVISKKAMTEMIGSYLQLNNKLMDKICQLQEELDAKNHSEHQTSFHEEYSIMNTDFNEIEDQIREYRHSLTHYQQQHQAELRDKNETIAKLNERVDSLENELEDQSLYIEELELKNAALEETKDSLLAELEEMEAELRRTHATASSKVTKLGKRNSEALEGYGYLSRDFSENVQAELEKLINKLMKELEHEQANKKTLAAEIRRLQLDIIDLEKEIIDKNNRIYSLELTAIKNSKSSPNLTLSSIRASRKPNPYLHNISFDTSFRHNDTEKTRRKDSKATALTLAELSTDKFTLKYQEKVYLCIQLFEAYIGKLDKKDASIEQPTSIQIQNFISREPHLYSLKINKRSGFDRSKPFTPEAAAAVVSNFFEMLDVVLQNGKDSRKNGQADIREKGIALLLSNARKNKNCKTEDLILLKQTFEDLLSQTEEQFSY